MSNALAITEIKRFLSSGTPEVLSISGRWGVGKTHAWDEVLKAMRTTTPLRQYAYVSVFGIKSLDTLKTEIVQSTVSLDGEDLEPTFASFRKHLSSIAGTLKLTEEVVRKSFLHFNKAAATLPYVGKFADLMAPGAALLIRNQIICIDDIERAGKGLDVSDILGLVSSLKERRHCKIVLLLNEDGLGSQVDQYRAYLEKAVDQAIAFVPTPLESANAAFASQDPFAPLLTAKTVQLGITNIRVIRRIRRFLSHIETLLEGLHEDAVASVVSSIVLLGWSVFEPKLAPNIERVRSFDKWTGLLGEDKRSDEDKKIDAALSEYGFIGFADIDAILLDGLKGGAFDSEALTTALKDLDAKCQRNAVNIELARPWAILRDSLDDNQDEFTAAFTQNIEKYAALMRVNEASAGLEVLREFGETAEADRLVKVYLDAQADKPREFFQAYRNHFHGEIGCGLAAAFEEKLKTMPLQHDPKEMLLDIHRNNGWNPTVIGFLASVPVEGYRALLKQLKGDELHSVITTALQFRDIHGIGALELEVAKRMDEAVRLVAGETRINAIRMKTYLRTVAPEAPDAP